MNIGNITQNNLEEIIASSSDAILALDEDQIIILFNQSAQNLFGYQEAEIIGQPLEILLPEQVHSMHKDYISKFDETPINSRTMSSRAAVYGLTKDKSVIPLEISIQKHPKEGHVRYSAICHDISTRLNIIEALQKSEQRLFRAQKIAQIGNWEWNIVTGDLVWSDEIYNIFEKDKDKFEATYDNFLLCIHPGDRDVVANHVEICVNSLKPYSIIHRIICNEDRIKVVEERGEVLCDADNNPIRMDGTVQDITKTWHKENELRLASEQAILANRTKSQFLSTMSHELRTPLNAIIGMSSMMEEETLGPLSEYDYKSYITDIKNSGHVLLNHINNMLDITDVELDIVDINLERASSKELIESCIDLVSGSSLKHNVKFKVDISDQLDEVETDKVLFRKILHNILSNAAKFSHYGGEVIVSLKKDESEKNMHLSVEDFGIGIAEDELDTIFEPFTQVDMEFTRKYDGAGLGLSVVKRFTEALGGKVDISSKVNAGTTLNVCLPIPS